ncbi:MAG: acetyl-CoA carboxylase biotin carboxyl carrier protein subunit [Prevotellaceae bacterium]|jgi:pyruvate/2-oxoglutarate dehydrogenase complex dihydrolipoamide acyltransferase (E2) component|nr:acetyl-CoA carboxylase biotin carboxyl carrier protein subunit [Prevotellaceae bacterium]
MYRLLINTSVKEVSVKTPYDGTVEYVNVQEGETVPSGRLLFRIHTVQDSTLIMGAPAAGVVKQVNVTVGSTVTKGMTLAVIENTNIANDWREADIGKDTIALTYAVNNIAELKSRQANRSNSVKLPRTHSNDLIFGVPSEPSSLTQNPYRYMDCRLFDDGVELFGMGAKIKLTETNSKEHVVCLYGSIFDLFKEMQNTSLRDLGDVLGGATWNRTIILSHMSNSYRYYIEYPLMEWYIEDNPAIFQEGDNWIVKLQRLFPAVSFRELLTRVAQRFGYTLELPQRILNDDRYRNAYIPFSRMEISDEAAQAAKAGKAWGAQQDIQGNNYDLDYYNFTNRSGNCTLSNNNRRVVFTATAKGRYIFRVNINVTYNNHMDVWIDSSYQRQLIASQNETGTFEFFYEKDLDTGGVFELFVATMGLRVRLTAEMECVGAVLDGSSAFPQTLDIASNMPDIKCDELFSMLARLWCLIPEVDEKNKILRFWGFDKLYENKKAGLEAGVAAGTIKDWSDKLDNREHKTQFRWNTYAQKNVIQYKEESAVGKDAGDLKITSKGAFYIDDGTLDREKTLFEIPAAATQETSFNETPMAIIDAGDGRPDVSLRLLFLNRTAGKQWTFRAPDGIESTLSTVWAATFMPVGMEVFISEYDTVAGGLLSRCRLMVEKLYLTPLDLKDFDHSIPVYLNKYGCCFYVNKINNYVPGKLTEVELVPLKYLDSW